MMKHHTHHPPHPPVSPPGAGNTGHAAPMDAEYSFGRVITAMVTPFDADGRLDDAAAERLAAWLTRPGWNDALVVNGTTGESISTDDAEKSRMITAAKRATAGTGGTVIAGVGSGSTRHSVDLAEQAAEAGADGLLVVAPYYSRPTQAGLLEHFRAIAEATPLPVMLYDIPQRTGVAIEPETLRSAAKHPRILAVKDAKGDFDAAMGVMATTGLAFYSGDDSLNLPWLSVGARGFVSVVGHVVGDRLSALVRLYDEGRNAEALALHRDLLPIYAGMFRAPGAASAKAALEALGIQAGPVRLPLVGLTEDQRYALRAALDVTVSGRVAPMTEPARLREGGRVPTLATLEASTL